MREVEEGLTTNEEDEGGAVFLGVSLLIVYYAVTFIKFTTSYLPFESVGNVKWLKKGISWGRKSKRLYTTRTSHMYLVTCATTNGPIIFKSTLNLIFVVVHW